MLAGMQHGPAIAPWPFLEELGGAFGKKGEALARFIKSVLALAATKRKAVQTLTMAEIKPLI